MTLYDDLGGEAAFAAVVEEFYARMEADPTTSEWFHGIDMERLKEHQRAFLAVGLGGPELYEGRSMRSAHAALAITDGMYSRAVIHLTEALGSLGVDVAVIAQVSQRIESMRIAIVTPA